MGEANPTHEQVIKDFLTQMATQDRRSTADIFYYVIKTKEARPAPIENCAEVKVYYQDSTYDSIEDLIKQCREDDPEISEEEISKIKKEAYEYGINYEWVDKQMFLTETEAKRHLKLNSYHYSKDAHTYVCHAWRAPDLLDFFKALFKHFNVDKIWG